MMRKKEYLAGEIGGSYTRATGERIIEKSTEYVFRSV